MRRPRKFLRLGYPAGVAARAAEAIGANEKERKVVARQLVRADAKVRCYGRDALVCPDGPPPWEHVEYGDFPTCERVADACSRDEDADPSFRKRRAARAGDTYNDDASYLLLTPEQEVYFQPGRHIGCGSFACAYERLDDTEIVKFTQDEDDVAALLRLQGLPNVVTVYDARELLRSDVPSGIYGVVAERLNDLGNEDTHLLVAFSYAWRDRLEKSCKRGMPTAAGKRKASMAPAPKSDYRLSPAAWAEADDWCQAEAPGWNVATSRCRSLARQVLRVHEEAGRRGVCLSDVHGGNWGVRPNAPDALVLLDAGVSAAGRAEGVEPLAGARRRRRRTR